MDSQFWLSIIKMIIFLPVVVFLAYLSLKLGSKGMFNMGNGKLIRIVERVPLSSKTFLYVAVINDKPYVVSSSEDKVEILMELPPDAMDKLNRGEGNFKESFMENFKTLLNRKDRL